MFSIVALTYNNLEKFYRMMQSMFILFTNPEVEEILILDNGSHQKELLNYLAELSCAFSKVEVIFSSKNLGVAGGRKHLFSIAKGEHIISVDSDVVFLDPLYLLDTLKRNLLPLPWEENPAKETFFLIGGGGGNHVHFPSLFLSDVKNEVNQRQKNVFIIVDEVAGWCQCFRKALLRKVEMDDDFNPFFGEDSDFCIQIKKLKGKCAIFGRGVINHSFSTCRNDVKRKPLRKMWEKVIMKWNDYSSFPLDREFYSKKYKTETPIQDYFEKGIFHGHDFSEQDYSFSLNTKFSSIDYLEHPCLYISKNYISGVSPLILIKFRDEETPDYDKKRKNMVLLEVDKCQPYLLLLLLIDCYIKNKNYQNVKLVGWEYDEFDTKYNRKGVEKLTRDPFSQEMIIDFETSKLLEAVQRYPVKKMLNSAKKINFEYDNSICPEYSPIHILPEIFLGIYHNHNLDCLPSFLTVVVGKGDDMESLQLLGGEILYIDTDNIINKISGRVDYYYQMADYNFVKLIEFLSTQFYLVYEYTIIVIYDSRDHLVVGDVEDFYERSIYQNQVLIEKDPTMFSFHIDDLQTVTDIKDFILTNKDKMGKVNIEKSIQSNIFLKIHFSEIWKKKVEDEVIIYYRDDDTGQDFPLIQN